MVMMMVVIVVMVVVVVMMVLMGVFHAVVGMGMGVNALVIVMIVMHKCYLPFMDSICLYYTLKSAVCHPLRGDATKKRGHELSERPLVT